MLRAAEALLVFEICKCAPSFVDELVGPIANIIKSAEKDFQVPKVPGAEKTYLPCFIDRECEYGGDDWICSTDPEAGQWVITAQATDGGGVRGTGPIRRLQEDWLTSRRGRATPQSSRANSNRSFRVSPIPLSDSPLYEEHLKRTMWGVLRSAFTREKMGLCVPADFQLKQTMVGQHQVEKFKPTNRLGSDNQAPIEFSMPSVLRQSLSSSPLVETNKPMLGNLIMGSLGVFQCYPMTKVGRHISFDHRWDAEGGTLVPSSFIVQYVPLMVAHAEDASGSLIAHRLIAEPYEFGVAYERLRSVFGTGEEFPERVVMHQADLMGVLSAVSELFAVAQLHPNLDDPLSRLQVYLDGNHLRLLQPIIEHFVADELRFYMSFKEMNEGVGMGSGTLPLSCETGAGESTVKVEISGFLPHPAMIEGLHELLWPGSSGKRRLTVRRFVEAVKKSTLDQSRCSVRIICLESP